MAHQHYKGTGKMHSFRGLLADEAQQRIRIQGATGEIAWRITKFEIMPEKPGTVQAEHTVKIYREEQSAIDGVINFTDDELLAAGFFLNQTTATLSYFETVIFDNSLFVRNIYITASEPIGARDVNYYIELEEVRVSAAGMAQLAVAASRRT